MRYIVVSILSLLLLTDLAIAGDISATAIKFYAVMEGDGVAHVRGKTISVKDGDRLEFQDYTPHSGLAPAFMEIGVVVANQGPEVENIVIRVAISPKIGKVIFYQSTPDLLLRKQIDASAVWFAPIILVKETVKNVKSGREVEVRFRDINLGAILKDYIKRNLWPVMLNIEASIEPITGETNFKNNTVKRTLKMQVWE